jgi:peptidoglycan/xylan/chitin deacetylase (PgdA/CDA1 family)
MSEPIAHLLHRKGVEMGLLSTGGAGKARVLMYHGIGEAGCHQVNVRHVDKNVFERQLRSISQHFQVVPLTDLEHGERHPEKLTVAITFDDGLLNNRSHALPLLEKYGIPATFYITGANRCGLRILWGDLLDLSERHTQRTLTVSDRIWKKNTQGRYAENGTGGLLRDHIKRSGTWPPKQALYDQLGDLLNGPLRDDRLFWELMSDSDLTTFAQHPLVTLGSHGWWHNDMGRIPAEDVKRELSDSKAYLEELTQTNVGTLAWPAGSYSSESIRIASSIGFTSQLAVDRLEVPDPTDGTRLFSRYGVYDFPVGDRWWRTLIAKEAHR